MVQSVAEAAEVVLVVVVQRLVEIILDVDGGVKVEEKDTAEQAAEAAEAVRDLLVAMAAMVAVLVVVMVAVATQVDLAAVVVMVVMVLVEEQGEDIGEAMAIIKTATVEAVEEQF